MQPGSFYAVVARSSIVGWLASRSSKSARLLDETLEACISSPSRSSVPLHRSSLEDRISPLHPQASLTKVQKYILNGGGVVVRQGVYELATECYRIHPYIYTTKHIICVFYGYLSNLDDLVLRSSSKLDPGLLEAVSYPSDAACMLERNRDVGTLSANVVLQAYLDCGEGNELVVLSELQGHYAFVIYDSSRRQAFAARDCSGDEKLYHYQNADNGSIAFTNDPSELPDAVRGEAWEELPPGHFVSGKHPKVQQFALTLEQLESLSAEMDSGIFGGCGGSDTKSRASMDSQFFDMDG